MADRIVVMNGGRIEQVGTPLELYDNPANLFVAGFIGSPAMNFIEGVLVNGNGGTNFRAKGGLSLPVPPHLASQSGREAVFGIRPEHIEIVRGGREPNLTPTISVVEPMGAETLILAQFEGGSITVSHRGRDKFEPGDKLPIVIDPDQAHVFDKATGARAVGGS